MADAIERLYKLTVDANQAIAQLEKLNRNTDRAAKGFDDFAGSVKKVGAAIGGALAVQAVTNAFEAIVAGMDDIIKTSQEIGVAANNLQTLRYAAQASGASAEELDKGLTKLSQNLQDVETGTSDAAKALRAMGVTGRDTADQAFGKIAEAFAKMPDGAQKTALAIDLLGKSGARLIPTLNEGAAGLGRMAEEAHELGLVINEETLRAAEAFGDQLDMMGNIAKANAQSFVAGMLPALRSIASVLIDATKGGEGFSDWGEAVGDLLLEVAQFATFAGASFQKLIRTINVAGEAIANPLQLGAIIDSWNADLDKIDERALATIRKFEQRAEQFKNSQKAFVGPPEPPAEPTAKIDKATTAVEKLTQAQQHAADMMKVYAAQAKANAEEDERAAKAAEERQKAVDELNRALHPAESALKDVTKAADEWAKTQEDEAARQQALVDLMETGTEAQKAYAAAELVKTAAVQQGTETLEEQRDATDVLTDSFEGFFENLAQGTGDAEELFKRMVQSMIAELLKLWAKKYIIDAISSMFGPSVIGQGAAFVGGGIEPFANGGVVGGPTFFGIRGRGLGLMGEAGPEAIMPLRRTADGALGVRAEAPAVNVQIQNFTDAQVSARRNGAGDLQVIIEQARKAVAADIRRGGTDIARAAEAAWRVSRGQAAPF